MELKYGKTFKNKTYYLLYPGLKLYGHEFWKRLQSLSLLVVAVKSYLHSRMILDNKSCLYIVIDRAFKPQEFLIFLSYVKSQPFYILDYPYDWNEYGKYSRKHVIVIEYPEKLKETYVNFINSKFSEMYKEINIEDILSKDSYGYNIIKRTKKGYEYYKDEVLKEFDVSEEFINKDSEYSIGLIINNEFLK